MIKKLRFFFTLMLLCVGIGSALAETKTGTITFGTNHTTVSKADMTVTDDLGNSWSIKTVFSENKTSFTTKSDGAQIGAKNTPATSITFEMTLTHIAADDGID